MVDYRLGSRTTDGITEEVTVEIFLGGCGGGGMSYARKPVGREINPIWDVLSVGLITTLTGPNSLVHSVTVAYFCEQTIGLYLFGYRDLINCRAHRKVSIGSVLTRDTCSAEVVLLGGGRRRSCTVVANVPGKVAERIYSRRVAICVFGATALLTCFTEGTISGSGALRRPRSLSTGTCSQPLLTRILGGSHCNRDACKFNGFINSDSEASGASQFEIFRDNRGLFPQITASNGNPPVAICIVPLNGFYNNFRSGRSLNDELLNARSIDEGEIHSCILYAGFDMLSREDSILVDRYDVVCCD